MIIVIILKDSYEGCCKKNQLLWENSMGVLKRYINMQAGFHMEMGVFGIFCIWKIDFVKPKSFNTSFWTKDFFKIYNKMG